MQGIIIPADLIPVEVDLDHEDGNALYIVGRVSKALRRAGNSEAVISSYRDQCLAGDYDHLLQVSLAFTEASSE